MKIALLCSGGDAAGMNPAIKKFVKIALEQNITPYLIYDGLEGLIDNNIHEVGYKEVAGILHLGGTIIRTSRSKRFLEKKYRHIAMQNLKDKDINKLIVLGGNGSFNALNALRQDHQESKSELEFIGIPTTIDNDIFGTDYCLGVDTALNMIRSNIDALRDTASSFKRAFVIEIMGRDSGYLTLVSAMSSGAELCIIPEQNTNLDNAKKALKEEIENGRGYVLILVAEGCDMTSQITAWCERELGIETRATILGHIQRGGNPSVYDRQIAFRFVSAAIEHLQSSTPSHHMVSFTNGEITTLGIEQTSGKTRQLKEELLNLSPSLFFSH